MTVEEMGPALGARSPALLVFRIGFFGRGAKKKAALASRPRPEDPGLKIGTPDV